MRGFSAVAQNDRRIVLRAALAAVLVSALALSACGRKGPLERPPSAAAVEEGASPDEAKQAGKPDRPLPLDFLL
jgi:predicted small lipoprotein YifL